MSLAEQFAAIQAEDEAREQRLVMLQLRKFLAGALCTECGEPLGNDEEIIQDDDEHTMHKRCELSEENSKD